VSEKKKYPKAKIDELETTTEILVIFTLKR
jgi:hypothetical protein